MNPRKKRSERAAEERELYRCWFDFLKLNEDYATCCENQGAGGSLARLYEDFGDIFNTTFGDWYETRAETLFKPHRFLFDRVDTNEAYRAYSSDEDHAVVLAINLDAPRELLVEEFPRFLAQIKAPKRGRRKREFSGARYPLRNGPSANTLKTIYAVYNAYLKENRVGNEPQLWKIGQQLLAAERDRTRKLALDERHNYDVRVRRYIDQAKALIRNAALNLFPIDKPADPRDYPSLQRLEKIVREYQG